MILPSLERKYILNEAVLDRLVFPIYKCTHGIKIDQTIRKTVGKHNQHAMGDIDNVSYLTNQITRSYLL